MENTKLDWMYKSSTSVDPEEYLLGRAIDKKYETQGSSRNEIDKDILPSSIFSSSESSVQVDVIRKIKEDPLEQIKQKEIEMRRQLLKNPVKLKKLQKMLKAKEEKKARKHVKKKKKEKNKSKFKEGDDVIGELLSEKFMKLIQKYGAKNLVELVKSDDDSEEEDMTRRKKTKAKMPRSSSASSSEDDNRSKRRYKDDGHRSRKESLERKESSNKKHKGKRRRSSSSSEREELKPPMGYQQKRGGQDRNKTEKNKVLRGNDKVRQRPISSSSSESDAEPEKIGNGLDYPVRERKEFDYSSDEGKAKFKKPFGLVLPKGVEPVRSTNSRSSERPLKDVKNKEAEAKSKYQRTKPTKLTEQEKEARLKEMMEDAQKWEKTRKTKVSKHREEMKKEEAKEKRYDESFMRNELAKVACKSVADRIKSNINNVQRSKFSMDQHFAKRT